MQECSRRTLDARVAPWTRTCRGTPNAECGSQHRQDSRERERNREEVREGVEGAEPMRARTCTVRGLTDSAGKKSLTRRGLREMREGTRRRRCGGIGAARVWQGIKRRKGRTHAPGVGALASGRKKEARPLRALPGRRRQ
jgi:hypothetical protein